MGDTAQFVLEGVDERLADLQLEEDEPLNNGTTVVAVNLLSKNKSCVKLDDFQIKRVLGTGGFGKV